MRKMISLISRTALILGVLVALTPCGVCHGNMERSSSTCSMKHMSGKMDCCHKNKPVSPLCKVMDQSSTVSVAKNLATGPVVVAQPFVFPTLLVVGTIHSSSVVLDTSPFRAPLSLRI